MWTVQFVNIRYKDLTCFYFEIWKRVAKQKVRFLPNYTELDIILCVYFSFMCLIFFL